MIFTPPSFNSLPQSALNGELANRWLPSTLAILIALAGSSAALAEPIRARLLPPSATNLPSPDVLWNASPNFNSRSGTGIDSIVIHTTESSLSSTINTFMNPATEVSAHFVIAPNGRIIQMVDTANRAWHATYYNSRSVGIEMVGYAGQPSTWNDNNLNSLMDLLAWLVTSYDISLDHPTGNAYDFPNDRLNAPGLVAHGQVQPWDRSDPGPYFPWTRVLAGTQSRIDAVPEPTSVALIGLACQMLVCGRIRRKSRMAGEALPQTASTRLSPSPAPPHVTLTPSRSSVLPK
jgi:N-acetyl-anhydromuramyl-L-alanine amidase AmpD